MSTFDRVILGVDFSDASRVAFEHAAMLARTMELPLLIVHAWNPRGWLPKLASELAPKWLEDARGGARGELDAWVRSAERRGVRAEAVLQRGRASEELIELAQQGTLLVVGRRGQASLDHVLLGSVTERVTSAAKCPVLVVPRAATPAVPPARLLVGVDFSQNSAIALTTARDIARSASKHPALVLAHARHDERALWLEGGAEFGRERPAATTDDVKRLARDRIARTVPFESCLVEGHAELGLVRLATEKRCDWIVLGVQGRTKLAALLIGSTTHGILRLADRPVLVAPDPEGHGTRSPMPRGQD